MPPTQPGRPPLLLLLLLLLTCQPQAPSAQVMDFLFEKWKLYGDQCHYNLSLLPPPAAELVCNRTFDRYSCWPDTPPNTTARVSCPWYLPWHHKVQHRHVFKRCGPDGRWVRGPQGQPWRNASQCQVDAGELKVQREAAQMYRSFQATYTVGYCLSLGALLLALAVLLGLSQLHCTRTYIHMHLFASFALRASSVLAVDALLKTRYSEKLGDDLSVSVWLSDGLAAGGGPAPASPARLLRLPRAQLLRPLPGHRLGCWTSNDHMGFWWVPRVPVFLAVLINFVIFVRVLRVLVAKLRARQMRRSDYKFRLAKSTLTLIPLLGVHEVVFAFVTDEHAQGTLRSAKLFFDLFLSSFQGLLVAVLYCFLNKEVQSELLRRWSHWRLGKGLREERVHSSPLASAWPPSGAPSEKLLLRRGGSGSSHGVGQDPSAVTPLAGSLPGLAESPF
ncbi:glucagon receptor isoform X10 [Dasypus novemcinctus]|uniref:glucagon receptor isoform X10 n=1 Tax=Dasypus novemcinctus TaxID=9361 RepID=UPI00265D8F55|nr:glucagon receptor isoform X9 [Dasypus novemcinctus]